MNKQEILKGFIQDAINVEPASLTKVEEVKETKASDLINKDSKLVINVDTIDVPEVEIKSVYDTKGRLSDIVDAVAKLVGYSVIPLEATNIPREVQTLQRHKLYSLGSTIYAMDNEIDQTKVNGYVDNISKHLEQGVSFVENITRSFEYQGTKYTTLDLTQNEWTFIFSKFKNYQKELALNSDDQLILTILPERVVNE